jgi:putative SOS response-associated peptidase YedK
MMRWGLLPHWAKDEKIAYSTFNARAEEFTGKPAFRDAWKNGQRCLVVTDGFYEWKKLDPKGKENSPTPLQWRMTGRWSWRVCGRPGRTLNLGAKFRAALFSPQTQTA